MECEECPSSKAERTLLLSFPTLAYSPSLPLFPRLAGRWRDLGKVPWDSCFFSAAAN